MIVLFFVLNFVISWFNAWAVGRSWAESKHVGGWPHFMNWMGAIMAASGFTWCFLVLIGLGVHATGYLPEEYLKGFYELGYVIIIVPVLGSGLAITIDAWAHFWKKRTLGNGAVATYDTFAQIYNTYQVVEALPGISKHLGGLFDVDDDDDAKAKVVMLMVVLVVLAAAAGIFLTVLIVKTTARNHALEAMYDAPEPERIRHRSSRKYA